MDQYQEGDYKYLYGKFKQSINKTLINHIIIPVGSVTDVVLISPSPAELLPAILIAYVPN